MFRFSDKIWERIDHILLFSGNTLLSYLTLSSRIAKIGTFVLSIAVILGFVYGIGFNLSEQARTFLLRFSQFSVEIFTLLLTIIIAANIFSLEKSKIRLQYLFLYMLLLGSFLPIIDKSVYPNGVPFVWTILSSEIYRVVVLMMLSLLTISSSLVGLLGRRTNPSVILLVSFAFFIIIGAGLLLLPNSTNHGISIVDAFFVSTSAVCVTGLSPFEMTEVFTQMGQYIILFLIQIGGLGVMTLTSFFALFFMGNASLHNQIVVSDIVSSKSVNSLLSTLVKILGVTILIESLGFIFIWATIHGTLDISVGEEFKFALFHTISAFCNAGFSTMTGNFTNPLLSGNSPLLIVVAMLIIFGGIGFPIIINFFHTTYNKLMNVTSTIMRKRRMPRNMLVYNINTKLVLVTTMGLLVIGTVFIALFEWEYAFAGLNSGDKITQAFFAAVSPRTAGFNSIDMTAFSAQTFILTVVLMWIGGGSQSTAGGIKVSTFAVSFFSALSLSRGKDRVDVMGRQISWDSIGRANTTIFVSIVILIIAVMTLSVIEPDIPLGNILFECVSAISTVGLSLNTTPLLSEEGKVVIIVLMYVGRIGIVTLLMGLIRRSKNNKFNYPTDDIIIT